MIFLLGSKIKEYRELKNLTQEGLADLLFISPKTLGHYETGARDCGRVDVLAALTKVLNFSVVIKNGKVYVEEDFKMNKETIKSKIMDINSDTYKGVIKNYLLWAVKKIEKVDNKTIDALFDSLKRSDISKIALDDKLISIEVKVYECEEYYLMDFRAFEEMKDIMIDAYLEIYNKKDLSKYSECIDDVWSFADWK